MRDCRGLKSVLWFDSLAWIQAAWYHVGMHFCLENGLMSGTGETDFSPTGRPTGPRVSPYSLVAGGQSACGGGKFSDMGTQK